MVVVSVGSLLSLWPQNVGTEDPQSKLAKTSHIGEL